MKKLMFVAAVAMSFAAFADEAADKKAGDQVVKEESGKPILWGFANYGFYSGYQLYGSLVNPDPTLQGYAELNANLLFGDYDFGYFGGGLWSNSDLTTRRHPQLRRAFNEWDFNLHWGRTFFFDDDCRYGIDYRTSVVWYYYPPSGNAGTTQTKTTFDWNHSFAFVNPFVTPFLDVVHEYTGHGTLFQFGLKRDFSLFDSLTLTPSLTFVGRNSRYGWCFPNYGLNPDDGSRIRSGLATMKIQLDATWMITDWMGVFAKVGYNRIIQEQLRDAVDNRWEGAYGCAKDFAWGGFGLCFNF